MDKDKINKILKKDIDNEKLKKILLYFLAFFIPILVIIIIFAYLKVYPFGEYTYLPIDSYDQYISFLKYFKYIFLGDEGIFYSLGKSLGGETYGLIAYYLLSPFNLIALFFEDGNMSLAFSIILTLKMGATGLSMMYYLNRNKKVKFTNLIFAFSYVFCSYIITYGFNIMWLDSVIFLPIVVASIEDIIKEKKYLKYVIVLVFTLITNYYIGFMVCIFSAIYFVYKLLLYKPENRKEVLKRIRNFYD
ncbi:MAG: YfhO family protein [Clostridia bacterium]|nr:YfhO family protein [Clostridia bacterium]